MNTQKENNDNVNLFTIESLKNEVEKSLSSIFTKDDILKLLDNIKQDNSEDMDNLFDKIKESLKRTIFELNSSDVIDYNNIEFTLNGNEINVEGMEINTDEIWDLIENEITDIQNELKN